MENYLLLLSHSAIFSGVSEDEIQSMLGCLSAVKKSYEKDNYIFRAGDATSSMGLLLSGSALLMQEDLWGRRNIIAKINPGEAFAEVFAASPGTVLNQSVVANEKSEILFLDVNKVMTTCPLACSHHVKIIRNLVSVIAKRALLLNDKITHMSKHSTREKLLSYLSAVSMRENNLTFDIPYDRQQLADYLGVERAAMSVELSKLQKEGFITYHKNHFSLHTREISG